MAAMAPMVRLLCLGILAFAFDAPVSAADEVSSTSAAPEVEAASDPAPATSPRPEAEEAAAAASTSRLRGASQRASSTDAPTPMAAAPEEAPTTPSPEEKAAAMAAEAAQVLASAAIASGELAEMAEAMASAKASGEEQLSAQAVSLATSTMSSCGDVESCLQIVDSYLTRQPRSRAFPAGAMLLQTFGHATASGGGPCGNLCKLHEQCTSDHCRYDPYDNAVTAIYLSHRGRLDEARGILDALRHLLYPYGDSVMSLLHSAYHIDGSVLDHAIDTGNNAWAGMAFAHFAAASGEACYAAVAHDILRSIVEQTSCQDALGGFMGRMPRGAGRYRATEHNIDMYALAHMLGDEGAKASAKQFVSSMYGFNPEFPQVYATGTTGARECDTGVDMAMAIAVDAQFWNLLSGADEDMTRKRLSTEFSMRPHSQGGFVAKDLDVLGDGSELTGVLFTSKGHGAQWENTASAVMAIGYYDAISHAAEVAMDAQAKEMENSLYHQLAEYGSVLASVRGGNYQAWLDRNFNALYPGGSDTGIGWSYFRYPHTAATAWTGLMLLQANPFAPPPQKVPASGSVAQSCR